MKKNQKCGQLKTFFHNADLFKAPVCLRAKGQPQISSICTGILSILLIALFLYLIISKVNNVINYENIKSSKVYNYNTTSKVQIPEKYLISVAPAWINFLHLQNKFDFSFYLVTQKADGADTKFKQINKKRCDIIDWAGYEDVFETYLMEQNYCLDNNESIQLYNRNIFQNQYLAIVFEDCRTQSPPCSDSYAKYFTNQLVAAQLNYFSIYLIDTAVNQYNQTATEKYLVINYRMYYHWESKGTMDVYLSPFSVKTDTNVFPFIHTQEKQTGFFIQSHRIGSSNKTFVEQYKAANDQKDHEIAKVKLMATNNFIQYSRQRGKIDVAISDVGGLFVFLILFFWFFVYTYNKYAYELLVAESLFILNQKGEQKQMKNFHYFSYMKFQIYDWIYAIFNKRINWQSCKKIDETKTEANIYIDVRYLFRKLRLTDMTLRRFVTRTEQIILSLIEQPDIKVVQKNRDELQYYNQIIQGKSSETLNYLLQQNQESLLKTKKQTKQEIKEKVENVYSLQQNQQKVSTVKKVQSIESAKSLANLIIYESEYSQVENSSKQFKQKIRRYLQIQNPDALQILANQKQTYEKVCEIKLSESMTQTEKMYSQNFHNSDLLLKQQFVYRIPIKILFRICKVLEENSKNNSSNQNSILRSNP